MNKNKKIIIPFSFIVDKCNVTVTRFTHDVYSLGLIVSITVDKYAMYVLFLLADRSIVVRALQSFVYYCRVVFMVWYTDVIKWTLLNAILLMIHVFEVFIDQSIKSHATRELTRDHITECWFFVCKEKKNESMKFRYIRTVIKKFKCEKWKNGNNNKKQPIFAL